jgi:intracellular sulfur oxidation DsrE/DsrF family protein
MSGFRKKRFHFVSFMILLITGIALGASTKRDITLGTYENPLPIEKKHDIRVVYQFKTDAWKNEIGAGLHYLQKLVDYYAQREIPENERHIHGVFQGEAAYMLLNDAAYSEATSSEAKNPNAEAIDKLLSRGVHVEICASTMRNHGWTGEDLYPGIRVVAGAYPRVIDLQQRGFAYIRF